MKRIGDQNGMPEKRITVSGIEIIVLRKKIKNMYLRVLPPDGRVQITAPIGTRDEQIRDFVQSRLDWIAMQQKRVAARRSGWPKRYETGETVWLWGKPCRLEFQDRQKTNLGGGFFDGECSDCGIFVNPADRERIAAKIDTKTVKTERRIVLYADRNSTQEQREKILKDWYRSQMKEVVPPIFAECEEIVGVRAKEWRIRDMKTRWGTCNPAQSRIWLNLRLTQMPPECLKYVIIHELTHLLEPSHNQRFYHFMDLFLPEWRAVRATMKEW